MMGALIRIVVVFAAAAGVAVAGEEGLDLDELVGTQWYGIYVVGQKAGYVSVTMGLSELDGTPVVAEKADMRVLMMVGGKRILNWMKFQEVYAVASPHELMLVESENRTSTSTERLHIERDGEAFAVTHLLHGRTMTKQVPASRATLHDALAIQRFVVNGPEVGEGIRFITFDDETLKDVEETATVLEVVEEEWRGQPRRVFVVESKTPRLTTIVRYLEDGTMISCSLGGVMTLRLEEEATARRMPGEGELFEVRREIPVKELDVDGEKIGTLTLAIVGLPEGVLVESARQSVEKREDGALVVTLTLGSVPVEASVTDEAREQLAEFLESTDEIQAEDERIRKRARRIVRGGNDPVEQTRRISRWVYRHVEGAEFTDYETALDVLIHLKGDCTEHTLLFVALCRAAGLPAREVSGLVYAGPGKRVFGMHRWAQVFVGEWVDVDPTLNQLPADATHVELDTEGDRWFDLLAAFAEITIEVLDVETKKSLP